LEGIDDFPRAKGRFLCSKITEVLHALQQEDHAIDICGGENPSSRVRWEPPEGGWIVLNTDGVAQGNLGPAGAGGVLRGSQGEWIVGFSEHLGHCSSVRAELRAVEGTSTC